MTIRDVIIQHGQFAHGGDVDQAAEAWEGTGMTADEVHEWLAARCFSPDAARDLADAGMTAEMARTQTSAGAGEFVETLGFKVSDGDLSVEEARDLAGAF